MQKYILKKGLSLPITGAPSEEIEVTPEVARVGIVGDDFEGLKPSNFGHWLYVFDRCLAALTEKS